MRRPRAILQWSVRVRQAQLLPAERPIGGVGSAPTRDRRLSRRTGSAERREGKPSWLSDLGGTKCTTFVVFIRQLHCNWKLTAHNGAYLFVLLFFFQFSFFLCSKLGLFLLFPFAFIFTSLTTHICFSVIEYKCSSQLRQTGLTFSALGPFGPRPSVYDTRCPSWSSS